MKSNNSRSAPTGWNLKKLGDLGLFLKGKGILKEQLSTTGLPCIRYGEIYTTHDYKIKDFHSFISRGVAQESERIFHNDILFAGSGETLEEIGKAVAYTGDAEAYAGGDIVILRTKKENSAEYLVYALNTNTANRQKRKLGQGHSVVHIYSSDLKELVIPIPPLLEQKKIALILSTWDKAIEKTEQLIAKKQQLKKGLMQQLLTGKVRFKEFVKSKSRGVGEFHDWARGPLKNFIDLISGQHLESAEYHNVPGHGIPYFTGPTDFTESILGVQKWTGKEKKSASNGDVLVTVKGSGVGQIHRLKLGQPVAIGRQLMAVRGIEADNGFLFYLMLTKSHQLEILSRGNMIPGVTRDDILSLKSYLPPVPEQYRMSQVLETIDLEVRLLNSNIKELRMQKNGLMQSLLTGDVRVRI